MWVNVDVQRQRYGLRDSDFTGSLLTVITNVSALSSCISKVGSKVDNQIASAPIGRYGRLANGSSFTYSLDFNGASVG